MGGGRVGMRRPVEREEAVGANLEFKEKQIDNLLFLFPFC